MRVLFVCADRFAARPPHRRCLTLPQAPEGKGWREMVLSAKCLGEAGGKLTFASEAPFAFQIGEVTRDDSAAGAECSF